LGEALTAAWLRLRTVFRRRQLDRDLEDELAFHMAMSQENRRLHGASAAEAGYAARRQFGNVPAVRENCRELWTLGWVETWWQDLRYGMRQLRRNPGFTMVAAVTLGLGIGATTAIYSMLDTMLWKPMALPDAERLAVVLQAMPGQPHLWSPASLADIDDVRRNSTVLDSLASWQSTMANLVDAGGEALRVESTRVTANFFDVTGVQPELGRTFRAGEDQPGSERGCRQPDARRARGNPRGGPGAAHHESERHDQPDSAGGFRICIHGGADGDFRPVGTGAFRGGRVWRDSVRDFRADP
jgi:hypothetical protein